MLILALDTSSKSGSIALFKDETLLASRQIGQTSELKRPSASHFTADLLQLLQEMNLSPDKLDIISVAIGPGSFTGIRVGVVAAKTMAYALNCQVVGVNTLTAIAAGTLEESSHNSACAILDAQRGQVFAARFHADTSWAPKMEGSVSIVDKANIAKFAGQLPLTGPALTRLEQTEQLNSVNPQFWQCSAERVGRVSIPRIQAKSFDNLWSLKPKYYRASAAEEKRQSQHNS